LADRLTDKSAVIVGKLDAIRPIPDEIDEMKSGMEMLQSKIAENCAAIETLKDRMGASITASSAGIQGGIASRLHEVEQAILELRDTTTKAASETSTMSAKARAEQQTLQRSVVEMSQEIERKMDQHLETLRRRVDAASEKSNMEVRGLQNQLSEDFDLVMRENRAAPQESFLGTLAVAENEAKLSTIFSRLKVIESKVAELMGGDSRYGQDTAPVKSQRDMERIKGEEEGTEPIRISEGMEPVDGETEVFKKVIDGKEVYFYCNRDGTYHT
jgi:hypothetical protein